jgi:hypothetical protein
MPVETISTNTAIAGKYFMSKHQKAYATNPRIELCLSFSLLIRAWSNPFVGTFISGPMELDLDFRFLDRIGHAGPIREVIKAMIQHPCGLFCLE